MAKTSVDNFLSFSVSFGSGTGVNPPVGEKAVGYIDTEYVGLTTGNSIMGSMTATLLIDGVPSGQSMTAWGSPTLPVGQFLAKDQLQVDVTRPGTYAAHVTGKYTFYQSPNFITRAVNVVVPLFVTATGQTPATTQVEKVNGPRSLAITKQDYRTYRYKVYVQDPDHALDFARIDDVYVPQRKWNRTESGWVIPYTKEVAPASPYEYNRLPRVFRYKISIDLQDKSLESWQVARAEDVYTSIPVTFRK